ncbi:MAG: IS110 family transposase [Chloroflexi bacterium]|nr:IS110 family transposase [Chloroflexota bacterium]
MEQFVERCAGLDVHKKSVTACVRTTGEDGTRESHIMTFGTTTAELLRLRAWLAGHAVSVAGMEATGVYWKPVFFMLESHLTCWLLNAQHIKNVPGRKTDVADAAWIAQLVEYGLVRPSFVPPPQVRALRELTRYRKSLVEERTREGQRLDKVLEDAGIKLTTVVSTIMGASARAIIAAMAAGMRDPKALADLAKGRLRAKLPQLQDALDGHFGDDHAFPPSRSSHHPQPGVFSPEPIRLFETVAAVIEGGSAKMSSMSMTRAEREAFLAGVHVAVVSVANGNKGPLTVPVWYRYEAGGDVCFTTGGDSIKGRLIRRAGRMSLCVQSEQAPYRYVSIEGPVSIEAPEYERDVRAIAVRYLGEAGAKAYLAGSSEASTAANIAVRLTPETWRTVDYGKMSRP